MTKCKHKNTWFDRSICPDPCGMMHTICIDCGIKLGGCPADDAAAERRRQNDERETRMITDLMKFWGRSEAWVLNYYRKPEEKT